MNGVLGLVLQLFLVDHRLLLRKVDLLLSVLKLQLQLSDDAVLSLGIGCAVQEKGTVQGRLLRPVVERASRSRQQKSQSFVKVQ